MYLGKVIGTVVSTIKTPSLTGSKFLIVEKINQDLTAKKQTEIAVDTVGAGDGETVIVVGGSSARMSNGKKTDLPVDAAIVGIVDTVEISLSSYFLKLTVIKLCIKTIRRQQFFMISLFNNISIFHNKNQI